MPSSETSTHLLLGAEGGLSFRSAVLVVIEGPDRGMRVPLASGVTQIGTAVGSTVRLHDPTVSRVHCELTLRKDGVRATDCGSTNGTVIDGVRVRDADIGPGSLLRVGATVMRVELGDDAVEVPLSPRDQLGAMLGASVEMRRLYAIVERVAPTEATVLVQGETGSGKELVAREVHRASPRVGGPFVAVDCGGIAQNVIESELFGHVRGAFSGAVSDRKGLFEEASGGTLFLDEIGELPLPLQGKLLRVLETREVRRVGGNRVRPVDVRVIAATNRPLAHAVNEGAFREELFHRLAVVEIRVPPLRSRRQDIPVLVQHFYERFGGQGHVPADLLSTMLTRAWPGNVRELRNFVQRYMSLRAGSTAPASTPPPSLPQGIEALVPVHMPLKEARDAWIDQFETVYVRTLLHATGGNVTRAAATAGISRRFLQRIMSRTGVRGDDAGDVEPDDRG
jgi:DNA-binding NtrC family response regulator